MEWSQSQHIPYAINLYIDSLDCQLNANDCCAKHLGLAIVPERTLPGSVDQSSVKRDLRASRAQSTSQGYSGRATVGHTWEFQMQHFTPSSVSRCKQMKTAQRNLHCCMFLSLSLVRMDFIRGWCSSMKFQLTT